MPLPALALIPLFPFATSILSADDCWLGEPYAFSKAECRITVHNADAKPLHVELAARGVTVTPATLDIPAKGSAQALVGVDVGNASGRLERAIRLHSDRAADTTVWARGYAMSVLDDPHPEIQLGVVDLSKATGTSIDLVSHDVAKFAITKVLSQPDGIHASIDPNGKTLHVAFGDDTPLGILDGDIKLAIDSPLQHEAWVHVMGDLQGDVTIDSNPYWFGNLAAGHGRSALVPLTSKSGAPFRIGAVTLGMAKGTAQVAPCEPAAPSCKAIRVVFDDAQRAGATRATLDVELPDQHRRMNLRIWGILQDTGTANDNGPLPAPPTPDLSAPWTEGIVDSVNAPVYAVPIDDPYDDAGATPPSTEPPPGDGPLLKWQTASEKDVYGYQVFRGDAEGGPFLLQNPKVLRTHAPKYSSVPYFWRDDRATKGSTYWYYIGVLYKDGRKQNLSAPHRKVAD